ncbi:MAG: antibiotic resistance protein VanZ [Rhodopirellula sp. JB055]|uniref:antibiotic resistance protein VanZ n=1 Tax=Rhodopirellula sp. JB055 TaxID=3342846 RepID=UPI00370BAD5E
MAHAPLFAGLTMLTLVLLQSLRPHVFASPAWTRRLVLVATTLFVAGVLVEMIQGMVGRSATVHDTLANGLGILAASVWFVASGLASTLWRRSLQWLGILFIATTWWGSFQIIRDCLKVESDFPQIASFETPIEITRWHFDRGWRGQTQSNVTDGQFALRWKPKDAPHPAMTLLEVASDWSDVETLELDIVLNATSSLEPPAAPASELGLPVDRTWELIVKVIDEDHRDYHNDVAKHFVTLRAGEPQHVIFPRQSILHGPDDRQLDLSRIKMISLLIDRPGPGVEIDVDHIHVTLQRPAAEPEP